jgi:hypothetical protein
MRVHQRVVSVATYCLHVRRACLGQPWVLHQAAGGSTHASAPAAEGHGRVLDLLQKLQLAQLQLAGLACFTAQTRFAEKAIFTRQ